MKRAFNMKQKAFFSIFKGLSLKQINKTFLEGESPTLTLTLKHKQESAIIWCLGWRH